MRSPRFSEIEPGIIPEGWHFGRDRFMVRASMESEMEFSDDVTLVFSGEVVHHVKYGTQFKSNFCFPDEPISDRMVRHYLNNLPHIGPVRALEIVKVFGAENVSEIIENEPTKLLIINGITPERIDEIVKTWELNGALRKIYYWLMDHHIPIDYANDVLSTLGMSAIEVLESNPYILTSIRSISFKVADSLAHRILTDVPGRLRVESCTKYALSKISNEGHLCLPIEELYAQVADILFEFKPQPDLVNLFKQVVQDDMIVLRKDGGQYVYLPSVYSAERHVAIKMYEMSSYPSQYDCSDEDIEWSENEFNNWARSDITLDDCQKEAIISVFKNKITVITGGGGTGKSTICRCINTIASRIGLSTTFLTPTGAAAKVLEEKTSKGTMTIHRYLKLVPGGQVGPEKKLINSNILLIDEFSMVGLDTLPFLMSSLIDPTITNIVLVGDPQQLPSVSPGNFLDDIMKSGIANVVKLTNIHRQSENSYIPQVSAEMATGKFKSIPEDATDISVIHEYDNDALAATVLMVAKDYMMEHDTLDGFQAISPMYKGSAGVDNITDMIQAMMKPNDAETITFKGKVFNVGDRVMQLSNNYEKDIFNGNIGTVLDVGVEAASNGQDLKYVVVDFGLEEDVKYIETEISQIRVCWCCTIHKYQGSQVGTVVLAISGAHRRMMSRELIYTGFTRASEMLHIIGDSSMLYRANEISSIKKRYTHTVDMIRSLMDKVRRFSVHNLELVSDLS